ncbi:MAG: methionine--tRNA ligase subunit beta [Candidatus Pacebacteria bacterium]|jgi:methionine--tRNA ligase beta chain|nr:methionine--tRNA ligase subunit beta [bacterium]MDP6528004.1 methionine--tRNA ligase subunit beta [Candidatus Paceibacterota bacterium]MDP6659738.1 methionine--tRNA ligase subunit beta [Candidatus Paceibacterota bacterium]|tara:strand:- start:979 stop:1302 length:324 start_codon:yes stop_codon:yes gene_type:complete
MISFEDFKKLDIRIGKVESAERIPETDKLLKLSINFGEETRQIVSGIAEYISESEIVGRSYPFIVNLEPRTIRGEESQGMILAVGSDDGSFSLLEPSTEVKPGSKIR